MSHDGGCLCGAVRYRLTAPLRPVLACHCAQCRRTSGHYWAATQVPIDRFALVKDDSALRWFESSPQARRGFCGICGASLFWVPKDGTHISIGAGTLDQPTGLITAAHIHCGGKGDYYAIEPGPEQRNGD